MSIPAVESAVTRLLVSTGALFEALTQWSELNMTEGDVSDVYVCLCNDLNAAVAAFTTFDIDTNELLSVPNDLRNVLEDCLSEEANSANLNRFLPSIRPTITSLLQSLHAKQSLCRRVASDFRYNHRA